MKTLILFIALLSSIAFAQTPTKTSTPSNALGYNQWSIGLNVGGHDGMHWTNAYTKVYQVSYFNGHIRYMHNNRFGWKLDAAYDNFNFINGASNTHKLRFSIEPTINFTDILHFNDFTSRFGLLGHFGFGYSAMWNVPFSSLNPDQLFQPKKGSIDEMGHLILGITPQFKVNEHWSINGDLAFMAHIRQNRTFDFANANPMSGGGFTGYMWNWSVGATYYIGKNKTHADWTYTPRMSQQDLDRIYNLEKQVQGLEQKWLDDDKDGVPNGIDVEANTPEGSEVDWNGASIQPEQKEAVDLNVIDSDGDGIMDAQDYCPTVKGMFNGCPEEVHSGGTQADRDAKFLAELGIRDVLFMNNSSYLNSVYHPILDQLIEFMQLNPEVKIELSGHADINGTDDLNLRLSEARVKVCLNYLVAKGVDRSRLSITFKGAKQVKYEGVTQEIHAANRRVSFAIVR
jgi:OOP family OmpA-OmpF porin